MSVLDRMRIFLAEYSRSKTVGEVPTQPDVAMSAPEAEFKRRLLSAGFSDSYYVLLGLVATVTADALEDSPATESSDSGRGEWGGYHRGLQTSLACLAMHETGLNPRQSALLVAEHIETLIRCRWGTRPVARIWGHG